MERIASAFEGLGDAFDELVAVRGDDDQPIVDSRCVELRLTDAWRDLLGRVGDEVVVWAHTCRKNFGTTPSHIAVPSDDLEEDEYPYGNVDEVDEV